MNTGTQTKLVHVGQYIAEVSVDLIDSDASWAPYLSPVDAFKLDDIRAALQRGDLTEAAKYAQIYKLTPIAI